MDAVGEDHASATALDVEEVPVGVVTESVVPAAAVVGMAPIRLGMALWFSR